MDEMTLQEEQQIQMDNVDQHNQQEEVSLQRMDWPTMVGRLDPDFSGLLVSSVVQGGLAWQAGIRAGDIVTALSATVGEGMWPTSTLEGVQSAWRSRKILANKAVLELRRLEDVIDNVYELTLEKPLGLEVQETPDGYVVVTGFTENAPNLVRYAVRIGDRITAVDSSWGDTMWPVSTVEGLISACTSRFPKSTVQLRFERPIENLDTVSEMERTDGRVTTTGTAAAENATPVLPEKTTKSPAAKQELIDRCRDVLRRYSTKSNDNGNGAVSTFKGKYDVPAIVADKVVDTLASERMTLDSGTLSMIMAAYLSCNQPESAIRVFEAAVGWRADGSALPVAESLIGRNGGGFIPSESALNLFVGTALMQAHAQRRDMLSVSRVLAALEGRSGVLVGGLESAPWPFTGVYGTIQPDTHCYNVAIAAAEKVGGDEALETGLALFARMSDPRQMKTAADRSPSRDAVTYNTMISALCNAGRSDEAFRLLDRMKRSGLRPDKFTYTSLIKACANGDDTQELLYDMRENGVKGDVRTYNAVIKTLCDERKLTEATKMVSEMENRGILPDSMTYGLLMNAMLRADKATACLTLFESACSNEKTAQLMDNVYLYTTAITAASRLGNYERALELVTRMSAKGVKPNLQALTAVVGACLAADKPDLAIKVYKKIDNPDGYALLHGVKAFCANGDYAEAVSVVKQQPRRPRIFSGKQMMLAYKTILASSLAVGNFSVARDTFDDLLGKGFIPNKSILSTMLNILNVQNPRQLSALSPSEATEASFSFLLYLLDSLGARNLPIESSLYIAILSLGKVLGGSAKRVTRNMVESRASVESSGTRILSTQIVDDSSDKHDTLRSPWQGWQNLYENDMSLEELKVPSINVRIPPKDMSFVLRAETVASVSKSRKRQQTALST
jgi:pentatricopeptide repeat protein